MASMGDTLGGGSRKAVVAVAHEMLRIVWFMLKRNEPYRRKLKGFTNEPLAIFNGSQVFIT